MSTTPKVFTEEQTFDMSQAKIKFPEGEQGWFELVSTNYCNGIVESVLIINHFDANDLYEIPASWIKGFKR